MTASDSPIAQPAENNTAAAEATQASGNLRDQYFACLASGKDTCKPPAPATGSLEMTSPYGGDTSVEVPRPAAADTVLPRAKWTMAINLTTTLDHDSSANGDSGERVFVGARSKTAQLLDLARQTRGESVNLVVQNAEPIRPNSTRMNLHTYLIHDGQIDELPTRPSAGVAADTQALLSIAARQAPSDRIGLISQSHGGGPHGISGDTGDADLSQLRTAITNGLAGSGHDRLDVLDFDACSMGNSRVLDALSGQARQIIASPEEEGSSGPHVDAQNEKEMIRRLIHNPDMTAADFGRMSIDVANSGFNGGESAPGSEDRKPGTPSLSDYDSSKVNAFTNSVENLGRVLNQAWANPSNRDAIRQAMSDAPYSTRPGMHMSNTPGTEERDAKAFAANILKAVDDHTLADPDGKIKADAQALLDARTALVAAYHGEHEGGYDQQGGVSLFLPSPEFFDNSERAASVDSGKMLGEVGQGKMGGGFERRDSIVEDMDFAIRNARRDLEEGALGASHPAPVASEAADFAPLEQARQAVAAARTEAEFNAAMQTYGQDVRAFEATASGHALSAQAANTVADRTREAFDAELAPSTPQFNNFLNSLYRDSIH